MDFTMGTGGHYITMLPADWSISTSHDPLPSSCHSEKVLWNLSITGISHCALSPVSLSVLQDFAMLRYITALWAWPIFHQKL